MVTPIVSVGIGQALEALNLLQQISAGQKALTRIQIFRDPSREISSVGLDFGPRISFYVRTNLADWSFGRRQVRKQDETVYDVMCNDELHRTIGSVPTLSLALVDNQGCFKGLQIHFWNFGARLSSTMQLEFPGYIRPRAF